MYLVQIKMSRKKLEHLKMDPNEIFSGTNEHIAEGGSDPKKRVLRLRRGKEKGGRNRFVLLK